jgi:hypothetical protein
MSVHVSKCVGCHKPAARNLCASCLRRQSANKPVLLTLKIDFFAYDFPMRQPNPNQFTTEDTEDTESKAFLRALRALRGELISIPSLVAASPHWDLRGLRGEKAIFQSARNGRMAEHQAGARRFAGKTHVVPDLVSGRELPMWPPTHARPDTRSGPTKSCLPRNLDYKNNHIL